MRLFSGYVVILTVVIGLSVGTASGVHISNHFEGDVIIDQGAESGNLIVNDGALGIGVIPNTQLIRAQGEQGAPARFLVEGNQGAAVFNLKATGGLPAVQITDGDTDTSYRIRIDQTTQDFELVDNSGTRNDVKMSISPNGDVCIGSC